MYLLASVNLSAASPNDFLRRRNCLPPTAFSAVWKMLMLLSTAKFSRKSHSIVPVLLKVEQLSSRYSISLLLAEPACHMWKGKVPFHYNFQESSLKQAKDAKTHYRERPLNTVILDLPWCHCIDETCYDVTVLMRRVMMSLCIRICKSSSFCSFKSWAIIRYAMHPSSDFSKAITQGGNVWKQKTQNASRSR